MREITRILRPRKRERLDKYLKEAGISLSRNKLRELIENGNILVNGATVKPSHIVHKGEEIKVLYKKETPFFIKPQCISLDIVYEDEDLILINKSPGIVTHPAPGHLEGTLVNAIIYHCNLAGGTGKRPGVVHRLDKDTSGLIVFAKTEKAHLALSKQIETRKMKREYVALAWGDFELKKGVIDAPLGRYTLDRKKMAVTPLLSRSAKTHYEVIEKFGYITYISLSLETGRTHQIRVHLEHIGHPVVGDPAYGGRRRYPYVDIDSFKEIMSIIKRQALHARALTFRHPRSGREMKFEAPLPQDMQYLFSFLRHQKKN
ncbi:hypothetical protein CH333_01420 [candidate division WOR-3 bacterium JGI_Cruoil_03_44_89]|uniref:Pseudouridine synthase n=1 Tax=candidate division WOR-3 bacterium JGI_Cruoil_03_44_89 TaxID=1973748 RepID=A0A235BYJ4_UNCW3|nr:MAG: hypothetical protein CH333_01420 [candidate division WOR-3 bacterium JGI_Cruoil_03_44_89]